MRVSSVEPLNHPKPCYTDPFQAGTFILWSASIMEYLFSMKGESLRSIKCGREIAFVIHR